MGLRRFGAFVASLSLAAVSSVGLSASSAAALTAPVEMTADELPTWQTNGVVWAMAQANGVVFTGGTFSAIRPPGKSAGTEERPVVNFAALDAATGKPTSCSLSFTVGTGLATVRALAVSPDQKTLYAGGRFGTVNGVKVSNVVAIDIASCTPKTNFRPSVNATVRALAITNDDIYLGGDFTTVAGQARHYFASVTRASGQLRPWSANADRPGRAVEVTPDRKNVLLGGDFFLLNGADSHALAVVNSSDGALTKAYPVGFIPAPSVVKDIDTDATGFYTAHEGNPMEGRMALNLSDFSERWRDPCTGATQAVHVYKDVVYSGSHAHNCTGLAFTELYDRQHLLAQSVNDPKILGWFPDTNEGLGEMIGPRVITTASSKGTDYMWVGGDFTTVNNKRQQGLTRFANRPDTGTPSVPQAVSASSTIPGQVNLSWQSSLDLDDSDLTYRIYRNDSDKPIDTVTGSSVFWDRPQLTFTDTEADPGTTYTYWITARDGSGNTSARSAPVTVTATASGPAAKPCAPSPSFNRCIDFTFSGDHQTFTIPKGVTSLKATLLGASAYGPSGGRGGQALGKVKVTPGQKITVTVGEQGRYHSGGQRIFGGGGIGGTLPGCIDLCGSSGAGMSALWDGAPNVAGKALLVAGGGGGAGNSRPAQIRGGDGGGQAGGVGVSGYGGGGLGGTQNAGGSGGTPFRCGAGAGGSQFLGGDGTSGYESGSGGGGGWFGGGGGACGGVTGAYGGAGGGGSSYASGVGVTGGATQAGVNPESAHGEVKLEFLVAKNR
ncbi:fibronectin type III domain-containing protein [Streptomyces sp. NPDC093982]|uniref:fibronectin type III domain-containing protein n=1 Tax=Streptomyces sp. NPDC093982 TaxID=3155077 RepID=UPI0034495E9F